MEALVNTLQPLLKLSQLLGAAPYPLKCIQNEGSKCLKNTLRIQAAIVALAVGATPFVILYYTPEFIMLKRNGSTYIFACHVCVVLADVFTVFSVCIGNQFFHTDYEHMLKQYSLILDCFGSKDSGKVLNRVQNRLVVGFSFVTLDLLATTLILGFAFPGPRFVPSCFIMYMPVVLSFLSMAQYTFFLTLNGELVRLVSSKMREADRPVNLHTVQRLRSVHTKLNALVWHINRCYGRLVFFVMTSAVVNINIQNLYLYQIYLSDLLPMILEVNMVLFLVVRWIQLIIIIVPNSFVQGQNRQMSQLLQELPITDEYEFNCSIEHYIEQLKQCKDYHQICGAVSLGMPLFLTIIGFLSTNMIVLIQFDGSK